MADDALGSCEPENSVPFFRLKVKSVDFANTIRLISHPQQVLAVEIKWDRILIEFKLILAKMFQNVGF